LDGNSAGSRVEFPRVHPAAVLAGGLADGVQALAVRGDVQERRAADLGGQLRFAELAGRKPAHVLCFIPEILRRRIRL